MLTICIPTYNFDITALVFDLHRQAMAADRPFELLVYDDGSERKWKAVNRSISGLEMVNYVELPENLGRSKIRNRLAHDARYNYLLFMDCDSRTVSERYIKNYLISLADDSVVYGGRCYESVPPANSQLYLRWFYGIERESPKADERQHSAWKSFMTNNFLVPKDIFLAVGMNENIKGYGHEDTVFAQDLKRKGIPIVHIDNPMCHIGLETAEEFLDKTTNGLHNLAYLIKEGLVDDDIKLYRYWKRARKMGLAPLIVTSFKARIEKIKSNLCGENPSLRTFDFYKLGYLLSITEEQ